jgi:hypothetical protein
MVTEICNKVNVRCKGNGMVIHCFELCESSVALWYGLKMLVLDSS